MPFPLPRSLICTALSTQGHVETAGLIGCIYRWGQGVAVDYPRAMAAYKIGAEGGSADCQFQLGTMLLEGRGVNSRDTEQGMFWLGKSGAQNHPPALAGLGTMAFSGLGGQVSWRRARYFFQRAIDLGDLTSQHPNPIVARVPRRRILSQTAHLSARVRVVLRSRSHTWTIPCTPSRAGL